MLPLSDLCRFFESFALPALAEEWDNVGLLVGDVDTQVERVMTCLTITPASSAEAVSKGADLIVTHHPLPFKPLRRLTTDNTPGRLLLELIQAGIAVYSPHTAFDSAAEGINQQLADGLGLSETKPLVTSPLDAMHLVGPDDAVISTAAIACGSGGSFLEHAIRQNIDLLVTGEASFHTCLEAEANGINLLLPGHFASERFAVERLAEIVAKEFSQLSVWASTDESDPLRWQS
ncbi:MAG: Nif3-like dinuclear metal center hexameric protein [Planctomycetales bacterium]|nr:Nif3-like dinuclear metal center hexameric protein [Planctomycetales bacterium]